MEKSFVLTCVLAALISLTMICAQADQAVRDLTVKPKPQPPAGIQLSCKKSECDFVKIVRIGGWE